MKNKKVSADTGYYSVNNLEGCKEERVDAYVPGSQFRRQDIRFADACGIVAVWISAMKDINLRSAGSVLRVSSWMLTVLSSSVCG